MRPRVCQTGLTVCADYDRRRIGSGSFAAEDDVGVEDVVAVLGDVHVAAADGEAVAAADPLTFGHVGAAGPGGLEGGAPFAGGGIVHGFRHPPVMDGAPDFRIVLGDDAVSGRVEGVAEVQHRLRAIVVVEQAHVDVADATLGGGEDAEPHFLPARQVRAVSMGIEGALPFAGHRLKAPDQRGGGVGMSVEMTVKMVMQDGNAPQDQDRGNGGDEDGFEFLHGHEFEGFVDERQEMGTGRGGGERNAGDLDREGGRGGGSRVSSERRQEHGHGHRGTATPEGLAQFVERTADAHLGRGFTGAQRGADLGKGTALEKTQDEGVAVVAAQTIQGLVEMRRDLVPDGGGVGGVIHRGEFLVVLLAAAFRAEGLKGDIAGGLVKPAGDDGAGGQVGSLAREQNENGLGDFLGHSGIAHEPQGGAVNHAGMALDEGAERGFGVAFGEFPQELDVIVHFYMDMAGDREKVTGI